MYQIVMRQTDLRGTMVGGDKLAQAGCVADGQINCVAMLPTGRFLVARSDSGPGGVHAAVFDSFGNAVSSDLILSQASSRSDDVRAIAHPSGYFVAVWSATAPTTTIYARVVYPDGSTPSPEVLLPSAAPGNQYNGRIAAFGSGEMVASWGERSTSPPYPYDVMERRFSSLLGPLGNDTIVSQSPAFTAPLTNDIAAAGTRSLVVWSQPGGAPDIIGRWVDQLTGPLGNEFMVNTYTPSLQAYPACAMDAQGRAVVLWDSYNQDGASTGVYGQRFDDQGNNWGPEFKVNMTVYNPQGLGYPGMLPSGDFMVAFGSSTGPNLKTLTLERRFFFPLSLAVAPGPTQGNGAQVFVVRPDGRQDGGKVAPYAGGYGAYLGAGNIDGTGVDEILTGPGPSRAYGPHVRAFRSDGIAVQKVSFYAYGTLRYGVKPQGADLDSDGPSEILSTPGQGAVFGPHVRGWNYDGSALTGISKVSFFAYGTLKYGANSSGANVDGDAYDEILTGPGPGVMFAPQVRAFNYDGSSITAIAKINANAFPTTSWGAVVSAADIESDGVGGYGDGYDEILVGQGPGSSYSSELRIFDYDDASIRQKFSVTPYATTLWGLHTAGGDVDAGDTEEIVTAPGPDPAATAHILCWEWNPALGTNTVADLQTIGTDDFVAFPGEMYGAHVAVGTFE